VEHSIGEIHGAAVKIICSARQHSHKADWAGNLNNAQGVTMMEKDSVVAISDKHDPTERAAKALQGTPETVANSTMTLGPENRCPSAPLMVAAASLWCRIELLAV
jgi:hypothetical protein